MKCPSCGRECDGSAHFCSHCGAALHSKSASAPPPLPKPGGAHRPEQTDAPKPRPQKPTSKPRARKKGCGFGSVLLATLFILGGGAAWFFTQQFRLERAAFEQVRHSENIEELERFLTTKMYMPAEHRRIAEARIARLLSDSVDFAAATTVEACEHYLTAHADGHHVAEVQTRLNRLRGTRAAANTPPSPTPPGRNTEARAAEADTLADDGERHAGTAPLRYHVVAASLSNYDAATLRAAELRANGYSAYVMEALTEQGRVYRVVVASYSDAASAHRTVEAVKRHCPDAWVMTK